MKILLTGATGFLGAHVLRALLAQGLSTVVIGRRPPEAGVPFLETNLLGGGDFAGLLRRAGATHLLHLAWYAEHGRYWTSPLNLRWVEATVRLVEAFCQAGGSRVVVAGTCAEYDWRCGYCREDDTPLAPATLYGVAKDATRRLVAGICAGAGVPWAWGRIFLPYGPGEPAARLIPSLFAVFRGQRPAFGVNAQAYRDFLHVADVADGLVTLARAPEAAGAHNIASGQPVRLDEVVRTVARLCDADPRPVLEQASQRPGEPPLLVGDSSRLRALGWRPRLSLADGLAAVSREETA